MICAYGDGKVKNFINCVNNIFLPVSASICDLELEAKPLDIGPLGIAEHPDTPRTPGNLTVKN